MANEPASRAVPDRRIGLYLTPRSVTPRVLEALRALGYVLDDLDKPDTGSLEDRRIFLVDAERLEDFQRARAAAKPAMPAELRVLLIAPAEHVEQEDPRIFAQTSRPGRLAALYAMIQRALEPRPRHCPRVRTRLAARCIRSDRRSIGALLSLSEGGCLLRTRDSLRKGSKLELQFALPDYGLISARAECRYARRGDVGLAFDAPTPELRQSIAHYVTLQLATGQPPSSASSGALSA